MNFTLPEYDIWTYLQKTNKTVVMYGMGNGADKILEICGKKGIEIADFFASDGFVRGHSFHCKTVLSYSAVKEKYGAENIVVLLSFASSLPDVLSSIRKIASECELYAPDVPVCGGALFDLEFYKENEEKINKVRSLLCDAESVRIYDNVIMYKLTGNIEFLDGAISDKDEVYRGLLKAEEIRAAADLGAYNGDTVRELIPYAPDLSEVYAVEPDRRSFRKLCDYVSSTDGTPKIHAVNAAAWSENTTLVFGDEGNRNSGIAAKGKGVKHTEVEAVTLDSLLFGGKVDYVKYDVEGAEREALIGSAQTLKAHHPKLLVSAYHKSEDIFTVPLQICEIEPNYKLFFRRYEYIPAWDLNLICI